ncbi:MAG: anhydro-N-acetylmuramic acid kinase [Cellvibrionaceae bacterium]
MNPLYIGLMSGTSADGIDATLIEINGHQVELKGHLEVPHNAALRAAILNLCESGNHEIDRMGELDQQLGKAFAQAAIALLQQQQLSPTQITAIGSHGQTIRHRPSATQAFTLQIADPNQIAHLTGITTIADFRRRDMAAGGEGAPLAPAFHQAVFSHDEQERLIINIGGISNISHLKGHSLLTGFDSGPGNALMDGWIKRHKNQDYDTGGEWANSGRPDSRLLERMLKHPYLSRPTPKSTGREDFHMKWLDQLLADTSYPQEDRDVQATLLEFTCQTIALHIQALDAQPDGIYICGGGALNNTLMNRLNDICPTQVCTTDILGIAPQQVEGAAFGWLAHQTLCRASGNCPAVTGAEKEVVLGGVYYA